MTVGVDDHADASCNGRPTNTGDKRMVLSPSSADADVERFTGTATRIADIDIVTTSGHILTGAKTQRDVVLAGGVVYERTRAAGRVPEAGCVAKERIGTGGCVATAGGIAKERVKTDGRVIGAMCGVEAEKRILTLSGVEEGIASVRWRINRPRRRRERKTGERQCDENCCVFGLSQRIHGSSFLFARYVDSAIRRSGKGEEPSGKMASA